MKLESHAFGKNQHTPREMSSSNLFSKYKRMMELNDYYQEAFGKNLLDTTDYKEIKKMSQKDFDDLEKSWKIKVKMFVEAMAEVGYAY